MADSTEDTRMSYKDAHNTVAGTLVILKEMLRNQDTTHAEQSLDWAVQRLIDHCWNNVAWQLTDSYKILRDHYIFGQD